MFLVRISIDDFSSSGNQTQERPSVMENDLFWTLRRRAHPINSLWASLLSWGNNQWGYGHFPHIGSGVSPGFFRGEFRIR